ncbi:hypothetical protein N7478_009158 [Penicillium angulare]|uniref:uncharacterized protein n=1 Tax=Penicillium angulare TaxID=116970 RepID=UPI0025418A61|nr:uncharacterized protein N7478_009158 [Penicillium angulare]KAJ5274033.1 hypothetical protein N7478_009158 [Penicillium angulare]
MAGIITLSNGQQFMLLSYDGKLAYKYGLEKSSLTQLANPPSLPTPPDSLTIDKIFASRFITAGPDSKLSYVQENSWYYYLTRITLRKLEIQIHASSERLNDENWHTLIETMSDTEKPHLQDFLQCITSGISEFETQLQSCWERLGSAMDINLDNVTVGCLDELVEYLWIKFFWIRHDLLRIALTMVLCFESEAKESSALTEFPMVAETFVRDGQSWFGSLCGCYDSCFEYAPKSWLLVWA